MKFKPLLSLSILIAVSAIPMFGKKSPKKDKKVAESEVVAVGIESIDSISTPVVPMEPDINNSYIRGVRSDSVLRLAIVLADITGNRDKEFSRGFLLGLQKVDIPEGSLSLKMINGGIPTDSLNSVLIEFNPDVIFSTHEKEMPAPLLDYALSNYVKLFSVFDAKGEDYKNHPGVYQLLTPSVPFNINTANYLIDNYGDHTLLLIGDPDDSDQIIREMVLAWPDEQLMLIEKANLPSFTPEEGKNYLIYPTIKSNNELAPMMEEIRKKMKANPLSGLRVVGRPNWVAINDLGKTVEGVEVLVPSKCYFDTSMDASKRFITEYKANYEHTPIKSFPVYSVMGSDAARYFVPILVGEIRGTVGEWTPQDMIQSYFSIGDEGWNQGAFNQGTYILHYLPANKMKKDLVN